MKWIMCALAADKPSERYNNKNSEDEHKQKNIHNEKEKKNWNDKRNQIPRTWKLQWILSFPGYFLSFSVTHSGPVQFQIGDWIPNSVCALS